MMYRDGGKGLILANINKIRSENVLVMTDPMRLSQEGDQGPQHPPDVNATSRHTERKENRNSGK